MTIPKAVAYARVSSKEQEKEGFSIPAQQKCLRGYAAAKAFIVAKEFVDIETAKETGRENFEAMLKYLRSHSEIRILLVEKTDRLYRNVEDWIRCEQVAGLEVHLVKEGSILSRESRSSDKFFHGIKVLMAKNYIDNLSEEARKGMQEKAEQGIWPSSAPIGYRNVVSSSGRKIIDTDPKLGSLVAQLFAWYATGTFSVAELTEKARQAGLVHRQSGGPMARSNIHSVLRNPIYAGDVIWKGRVFTGVHEPLVSRDLFLQVQRILKGRNTQKIRNGKERFAYSGLIRCGHCGCALVGERQKQRYVYYHCTGWKGKCPERYVREEALGREFAGILGRLRFTPDIEGWLLGAIEESRRHQILACDAAIVRLTTTLDRLQGRIEALYVDKLDGVVDGASFDSLAAKWSKEKGPLAASIAAHEVIRSSHAASCQTISKAVSRAQAIFSSREPMEQRRLIETFVEKAEWRDGALKAHLRAPFDLIATY